MRKTATAMRIPSTWRATRAGVDPGCCRLEMIATFGCFVWRTCCAEKACCSAAMVAASMPASCSLAAARSARSRVSSSCALAASCRTNGGAARGEAGR
eukprot:4276161-Pyramimonas_sp.AAC.1